MPKKIIAEGYVCLGCGKKYFTPSSHSALSAAQECEKKDAVSQAHRRGFHAWYCTKCKIFFKGELEETKCPKCGNVGRRICRPECSGSLSDLHVDYDLIDKELILEVDE